MGIVPAGVPRRATGETLIGGTRVTGIRWITVPSIAIVRGSRAGNHIEPVDQIRRSGNIGMGGQNAGIQYRDHHCRSPGGDIPGVRQIDPAWRLPGTGAVVPVMPLQVVTRVIGFAKYMHQVVGLRVFDIATGSYRLNRIQHCAFSLLGAHDTYGTDGQTVDILPTGRCRYMSFESAGA